MYATCRSWGGRVAAAAMGSLVLFSCGGPSETGILVNLGNVPAAATTITLKATLDGRDPAMIEQTQFMASGLSRFGLTVPAAASGALSIELSAIDVDKCVQGTAQTTVSLPTERGKEVVADFMTLVPRKCDNPPKPPACAKNTLCTYAFSPVNKELISSFAIAPNDIWAVGVAGTVLHWDGTAWRSVSVGTTRDLFDVWASGPNDVWIVGASGPSLSDHPLTLHYDGTQWSSVANNASYDLNAVWGISSNEVFAVGDFDPNYNAAEFWKWNGTLWSRFSSSANAQLISVWASGTNDVWAAGFSGKMYRYNGTALSLVNLSTVGVGSTTELRSVWGTSSSNVIVVGSGGLAVRYDGATWTKMTQSATISTLYAVSGTSSGKPIYAVGNNGWVFSSDPPYSAFLPSINPPIVTKDLRDISVAQDGSVWVNGVNGYLGQLGTQ